MQFLTDRLKGHEIHLKMFVVKIPLITDQHAYSVLKKRFNVYTHFYNAVLRYGKKCVNKIHALPEWKQSKELSKLIKLGDKQAKEQNKILWKIMEEKSGWFFHPPVSCTQKFGQNTVRKKGTFIEKHTMARLCNTLSERAAKALKNLLFYKSKKVNFLSVEGRNKKPYINCLTCLADGGGGIEHSPFRWKDDHIEFQKLEIPFGLDVNDSYHKFVKDNPDLIGEMKLYRERQGDRWQYYLQVAMKNETIPRKIRPLGKGEIGLDIGPSLEAYIAPEKAELKIFCSELKNLKRQCRILERKIDRQRRSSNPDCYDEKGRCIKGKHPIRRSKRQRHSESKLYEIRRQEKEYRRCLHGKETNDLRALGDEIYTEKLNIKSWQKRRKSKKGTKSGYGRSIGRCAPSMFLNLLKNKFETTGGKYIDIDVKAKLSQKCPVCGNIKAKSIKERIHKCEKCGYKMQRDLTSALLAAAWEPGGVDENKAAKLCEERGPLLRVACAKAAAKVREEKSLISRFGPASELEAISELELLARKDKKLASDAPPALPGEEIGKLE